MTDPRPDYGARGCCHGSLALMIIGALTGTWLGAKAAKFWATRTN